MSYPSEDETNEALGKLLIAAVAVLGLITGMVIGVVGIILFRR